MDESNRFRIVFAKLEEILDEDSRKKSVESKAEIRLTREISNKDLDEIDELRRIVLEATEPEPMSFTTT